MRERDMDYETNKRPRVKVVKKGSFFGKLLAVFLGFLLGIISCLGGIVGIGYYVVGVMKIEDGAETVNGFGLDFDYTDYISANFGDKTLIDYLTAVTGVFGEIAEGTGTLNDLNELSPYVKTLLAGDPSVSAAQGEFNGILPMLESLGLVLDVDEFMSKILVGGGGDNPDPTKYLTDYVMEETYKLPVGNLLSLAGMNPEGLIATLFYGEKGIDWEEDANGKIVPVEGGTPWVTISDVMSGAISERISSIPIYTVMEPEDKSDALMMSLVYGSSNRYTVKDNKVEMNQQSYTKDGDTFYDDTDKAVAATAEQQTDGSYKLTFAEGEKVQYVKAETQTLAASNAQTKWLVYSNKECTAPVKYRAKTLNDFTNSDGLLNSLTIADVLKVNAESNKIIISLAYGTLHEDYEIVKVNGVDTIQTLNGAKPRTLNDLTDTKKDIIGQIRLADVMDIDTQSNVMMYLMYGVKGVHYKLENDKPVPLTKQMVILEDGANKIAYNEYGDETLKGTTDGVTYVEDGVTYYLAPVMVAGEDGKTQRMVDVRVTQNNETQKIPSKAYYLYEDQAKTTPILFKPTKLMTLMDDHVFISGLTGRLTLEQTMGKISTTSPLYALKDVIVDDLPDEIDSLKIKDLFDKGDLEKNNILNALKESSLETLADDINDLPIADMFDETVFQKDHEDYNPILNALKTRETTITNLPEKIDLITIGEMFTEDDLKKSKILNALSGSTLDTMADDVNNLAVEKLFDDKYFDPDHADYNPIFKALKDKQATVTNLPEKIDEMTIGEMFKPEDLAKNDLLDALEGSTLDTLSDDINKLSIRDMFDENVFNPEHEDYNKILSALANKNATFDTLSDKINELKFSDVYDADEIYKKNPDGSFVMEDGKYVAENPVLGYLYESDKAITELTTVVDEMTIDNVFHKDDIDANPILRKLSADKVLVKNLGKEINELKVGEVFEDSIYKTDAEGKFVLDDQGNKIVKNQILHSLREKKISDMGDAVNDLYVKDVFGEDDIKDNNILSALVARNTKINDLSSVINTLTILEIFEDSIYETKADGSFVLDSNGEKIVKNKILYALRTSSIDNLGDNVNGLKFSDIYDADEIYKKNPDGSFVIENGKRVAENPVLGYLYESDKPIHKLTEAVDEMTVKNVFHEDDINANPLLKTLAEKDVPVKSLGEEINKLTVGEVFEDSIYKTDSEGKFVLDGDGNKIVESQILWALRDEKIIDMGDAVNNLTLKGVFTDKEIKANPILRALDKREIKINQMGDVINELTVGEVFEDSIYKTDENGEFVLDGDGNKIVESQILWALRDSKINEMGTAVNELYVKDVLPKDQIEGSPILKALVEKEPPVKVNQLGDCVDDLTIGDIYGDLIYVKDAETGEWATDESGELLISTNANHVLATLHDTKIVDLDTRMDSFTVGDMFVHEIYLEEIKADGTTDNYHFVQDESELKGYKVDPDANPILVHLRDTRVDKMSEAVAELTVRQIFEKEMFETKVDEQTRETYFVDENNVKTEDPNKYVLKGSWYYLLKETRPDHPKYNSVHYDYKLTDEMDEMINNMIKNMPKAELWELHEKKIIDLSAHDELLSEGKSGEIAYLPAAKKYYFPADHEDEDKRGQVKTHFRYLTVSELLGYVGDIIDVIPPNELSE